MFDWLKKILSPKPASPYMTETQAPAPPPDQDALRAVRALGQPGVIFHETDEPSYTFTGGNPHLGPDYPWPHKDGTPLEFMGQVDLAIIADLIPESPLPSSGILAFFYALSGEQVWGFDPNDFGNWKVEFSEVKTETPAPVKDFSQVFLEAELVTSFPSAEHPLVEEIRNIDSLIDEWDELVSNNSDAELQILGYPFPVQNDDMDEESAMASAGIYVGDVSLYNSPEAIKARSTAGEWILLAQFNSRESQELMFGDLGMIYYWIRKRDLAARDFSKTWLILQCS